MCGHALAVSPSLQSFSVLSKESGGFEVRCWLQSDNTVKELHNTYSLRMHSALVQAGVFVQSTEGHLGVGHTHEDVDGLLSLAKSGLDAAPVLHTPQDVIRALRDRLQPVFDARGLDLRVEWVSTASLLYLP